MLRSRLAMLWFFHALIRLMFANVELTFDDVAGFHALGAHIGAPLLFIHKIFVQIAPHRVVMVNAPVSIRELDDAGGAL